MSTFAEHEHRVDHVLSLSAVIFMMDVVPVIAVQIGYSEALGLPVDLSFERAGRGRLSSLRSMVALELPSLASLRTGSNNGDKIV
jgi:hypothetical protein